MWSLACWLVGLFEAKQSKASVAFQFHGLEGNGNCGTKHGILSKILGSERDNDIKSLTLDSLRFTFGL